MSEKNSKFVIIKGLEDGITKLEAEIEALGKPEMGSDADTLIKLKQVKVFSLETQLRELLTDGKKPVKFGMEHVEEYPTVASQVNHAGEIKSNSLELMKQMMNNRLLPELVEVIDETQTAPETFPEGDDGKLIIANKIKNRPTTEILELVETYTDELPEGSELTQEQVMHRVLGDLRKAHREYDKFVSANEELIAKQKTLSFERTKLERTLAGFGVRWAERNVRLYEGEVPGAYDIKILNDIQLPEHLGFQVSREIVPEPLKSKVSVIADPNVIQWCLDWNRTLLKVDAKAMEKLAGNPLVNQVLGLIKSALVADEKQLVDYEKNLIELEKGELTAKLLPVERMPVTLKGFIRPTVGKVTYEVEQTPES